MRGRLEAEKRENAQVGKQARELAKQVVKQKSKKVGFSLGYDCYDIDVMQE